MQSDKKGFTLIELIIVFIILGILGAIAIPKFVNLSRDAKMTATNTVAEALSAANSENFTARTKNKTAGIPITNCINVGAALKGGLPTGYTITPTAVAAGKTETCTLIGQSGTSATFRATGVL